MNIKLIENILIQGGIEKNEAKIEAKMLVKHFLKMSDVELILTPEFEECKILLEKAEFRAKTRTPIQQIIGTAYFMGEDFIVDENVLIPRDETEILVRKAISLINNNKFEKVLDIGVGSGCISCIVAKNTGAKVLGADISQGALNVAYENVKKLGLINNVSLIKSDIFSNVLGSFDLIISNPPYIPINQKANLQKELSFEPENALFTEDNEGIYFYKKIIQNADNYLNNKGYLLFELGDGQAELVLELMKNFGFINIEIIEDLAYIKRVIFGKKG